MLGYGGTTREDPKYPGTLSILDTVCVGVWGDNLGVPKYPGALSIPDTVCVEVWGDNSAGSRVSWDM